MKIVPTKKQKIISSPSTSVEGSEEESIKVNIITKPVEDDSEDNNNWKKVSCQLIPSKSTQAKAYYVCHIEDFDKAGTDKVKVGICVENSFNNKDFDIEYFMDDRKVFNIHRQGVIGSFRINKGENYFTKVVNYVTQTQNPFILEKNIIAEDVDDISESEVLEKIGKIKVIIKSGRRMFVEGIYAGASENSVNFENIKIKESQSKYKPLSVNLGGSVLVNYKPQITTLIKPQVYKEFEFEYYTKLGYLTKLRQYGLNIENILPYNPEVTNDEPEVIVIEDDEKNALDSLDFILREKLKDINVKDLLVWNCDKISKWIDDLDLQFRESNVGNVLMEHKIDGASFLELTLDIMKNDLNIVTLGLRLKLQRIINYLKNK